MMEPASYKMPYVFPVDDLIRQIGDELRLS